MYLRRGETKRWLAASWKRGNSTKQSCRVSVQQVSATKTYSDVLTRLSNLESLVEGILNKEVRREVDSSGGVNSEPPQRSYFWPCGNSSTPVSYARHRKYSSAARDSSKGGISRTDTVYLGHSSAANTLSNLKHKLLATVNSPPHSQSLEFCSHSSPPGDEDDADADAVKLPESIDEPVLLPPRDQIFPILESMFDNALSMYPMLHSCMPRISSSAY